MNAVLRTLALIIAVTVTTGAMVAFTYFHSMPYDGYYIESLDLVVWRGVGMGCGMALTIAGLLSIALALCIPAPSHAIPLRRIRYPNLFNN